MGATSDLDLLLRRALIIAAGDVFDRPRLVDAAELANALGRPDEARLLYTLSFVQQGFAPAAAAEQRAIAARTGLWGTEWPDEGRGVATHSSFAVDIAFEELKVVTAVAIGPLSEADTAVAPPSTDVPTAISPGDLPERMLRALRSSGADAIDALASVLAEARDSLLAAPLVDLRDHADADTGRLAELLAARFLQMFLRGNHMLAYPPLGSAALLHATAALDPVGLGPYLDNVPRLLRRTRDLAGMVRAVAPEPGLVDAEDWIDRWTVILAVKTSQWTRADLVDSFADAGTMRPIGAMLADAAARLPFVYERDLLIRIRDAGLDCNDLALAAAAQRLIVIRSNQVDEWIVLGDVYATHGDRDAAEAAYARCLGGAAPEAPLARRIQALREGDFTAQALVGGMHTPFVRQRMRLARWGAVPVRLRGALLPIEA